MILESPVDRSSLMLSYYLNPWVQGGYRVHDIDFTVESKNLSFIQRLSGHFLNRCGIKSSPKAPTFGVLCAGMNSRIQVITMKTIDIALRLNLSGKLRCGMNCTLAVAHDGVATPWNRTTIPRHYALSCITASAHFTLSN